MKRLLLLLFIFSQTLMHGQTCGNPINFGTNTVLEDFFLDVDNYDDGRIRDINGDPLVRDDLVIGGDLCADNADLVYYLDLTGGTTNPAGGGSFPGIGLTSLEGIEEFFNLESLFVQGRLNELTELILDQNIQLVTVRAFNQGGSGISTINLDGLTRLDLLGLGINSIQNGDFSTNSSLRVLDVQRNDLTSIVLHPNAPLENLVLTDNDLTTLDISNNDTNLTNLRIQNNPNLTCVRVSDLNLVTANVPANWAVDGDDTSIFTTNTCTSCTTVAVSPSLETFLEAEFSGTLLDAGGNNVTGFSDGPTANGRVCANAVNQVVTLDATITGSGEINDFTGIAFFTNLEVLEALENNLIETDVDLSSNIALTQVNFRDTGLSRIALPIDNQITILNVALNPALTSIDLAGSPNLETFFSFQENPGTGLQGILDLSGNNSLGTIGVENCSITGFNWPIPSALFKMSLRGNQLAELDLRPLNTLNIDDLLTCGNPLTCIQVDDVADANGKLNRPPSGCEPRGPGFLSGTGWWIEDGVSFTTGNSCANPCTTDIELGSQEEVDAFVADLQVAGCTVFEGDRIFLDNSAGGTPINDISGLSVITNSTQNMFITIESTDLTSLNGIQGFLLQNVSTLEIEFNDQLTDLSALNGLNRADQIVFGTNNSVTDMSGFIGLTACRLFTIRTNQELTSLNGLQNLEEITGLLTIEQNNLLSDYCALQPRAATNATFANTISINGNAYNPSITELQNPATCSLTCTVVDFIDDDLREFFLDVNSYANDRILDQNGDALDIGDLVLNNQVCAERAIAVYSIDLDDGYLGRTISSLGGLEFFTNLREFDATNAFIEGDIDLRPITSLVQFNASDNNISSVTASGVNTVLQRISVGNQGPSENTLTSINITQTINSLTSLEVGNNQNLTVLDLTLFPNLMDIGTIFTGITELDFSALNDTPSNANLNDGALESLNLRNPNLDYTFLPLFVENNNLSCIQVNDGQESLAQEQVDFNVWEVDPGVTFNTDCNIPVASIEANIADASETGPVNGQFIVSLSESRACCTTTVNFTVNGTATEGLDYQPIGLSAVIPAGETSVPIDISVINNDDEDSTETVEIMLVAGTDYNVDIANANVMVTIQNDLNEIFDDVPSISTNTFRVNVTGNSCRGQENGTIALEIGSIANTFNAVLGGDNRALNANSTEIFDGLSSGEYSLTITSTEFPEWSQVFRVTVGEAAALDLQGISIDEEQNIALIRVIGSQQYTVTNNGKEYGFDGFADDVPIFIKVPIENGLNNLTIEGEKACQGILSKQLYFGELFAYPIPASEVLNLEGLPQNVPLSLQLFDVTGKMVYIENWENAWPGRAFDLSRQVPGKYFLRITGMGIEENIQLSKR